jgi:prophage antirepressor-like protein
MDSENVKDVEKVEVTGTETFDFKLGDVDCFENDNTIWFKLADIGRLLELSDSSVRKMKHDKWFDDDEIIVWNPLQKVTGSIRDGVSETYVSESALYRILNRSNSPKARPFERWVTKVVIPSIRKTGKYEEPVKKVELTEWEKNIKSRESMARLKEAEAEALRMRLSAAHMYTALAEKYKDNKTYEQILDSHATYELSGEYVLPLPKLEEPNYSATEVGKMLGISANKVGSIANSLNMKMKEFGQWYVSKSLHSNTEVNTFRYNQKGIQKIKEYLHDNLSV